MLAKSGERVFTKSGENLVGARRELADIGHQLAAAQLALDVARRPVENMRAVISEAETVDSTLAEHRLRHEQAVSKWIASGAETERPAVPLEMVNLERKSAALRKDAAIVRRSIADHESGRCL